MWGLVLLYIILGILFIYCLIILCLYVLKTVVEPENKMCDCPTRLDGKTVLVTGGNSGIGFETAKDLARRGARVIIADVNDSIESVERIIKETGNKNVEYRHINLADFKSVKAFADNFNRTIDRLDILVNNAGCIVNKKHITDDGMDLIMQVNYFGPFLLTHLLLDKLQRQQSRIVIVSSGMYYKGELDLNDLCGIKTKAFYKSYVNSKLCTMLWTKALSKKLPQNVSVFCLHPGMVITNIVSLKSKYLDGFSKWVMSGIIRTPLEGAQTSVHVCVAPGIEKATGGYFSNCKLTPTASIKDENKMIEDLWNETMFLLKVRADL